MSPPGETPEIFAEGIISSANREHSSLTVSPDGRDIYFTRQTETSHDILFMHFKNGQWSDPEPVPFTSNHLDDGAAFSLDSERLYFSSKRPIEPLDGPKTDKDIWYVEQIGNGWNEPVHVGPPLNTDKNEGGLCFTETGYVYFHSDRHGVRTNADIYRARYADGVFFDIQKLSGPINTPLYEAAPFVAPDESYMIYYQIDLSDVSNMRLNLSFRQKDGSWSEPMDLSRAIGLGANDIMMAKRSPDGKYLFILDQGDIYWVDARVIENLRPKNK